MTKKQSGCFFGTLCRHRHLILHRHTKFHVNRTIGGVVITSLKFSTWRPLTSRMNFRFQLGSACVLRMSRSLSLSNFVKISQSTTELKLFRFEKKNGRRFEILLPVSTLTYRSSSVSHFAYTKFRTNLTVGCLTMALCQYSRWRTSAMLYFMYSIDGPPTTCRWWCSFVIKFRTDWMYGFGDIAIFRFWQFGLKMPIHAPHGCVLWHTVITSKWCHSSSYLPKDRPWTEPRHLSDKVWKSTARFELGVGTRKKGQYKAGQEKVTKGLHFTWPIWEEAPTEAIHIKNCLVGDILEVIVCAKFQNDMLMSYDFTGGRIFHFLINFWMGFTTVQILRCLW